MTEPPAAHRFLQSPALAIKIVFGFNSTLIVDGSYFCHDDPSQAVSGGRSLGHSDQFRPVCGRARRVADHAVLERTGWLLVGPANSAAAFPRSQLHDLPTTPAEAVEFQRLGRLAEER